MRKSNRRCHLRLILDLVRLLDKPTIQVQVVDVDSIYMIPGTDDDKDFVTTMKREEIQKIYEKLIDDCIDKATDVCNGSEKGHFLKYLKIFRNQARVHHFGWR